MVEILFIIGIFFLWKGQMKFSKKDEAWPKSLKTGRIVGALLMIPLLVSLAMIFFS